MIKGTQMVHQSNMKRTTQTRLPLRVYELRLLLFVGDLVAISVAMIVGIYVWNLLRPTYVDFSYAGLQRYLPWLIAIPTFWYALTVFVRLYDLRLASNIQRSTVRLLIAFVAYVFGYLVVFFLSANQPNPYYTFPIGSDVFAPRLQPAIFGASVLILTFVWRLIFATEFTKGLFRRRALVVGAGLAGRSFIEAYNQHSVAANVSLIGLIDDDSQKHDKVISGYKVLGDCSELVDVAISERIDEIVLAVNAELNGGMFQAIMDCFERGVQITPMSVMYERITGSVPVEHVGNQWHVALHVGVEPPSRIYKAITRFSDIVMSVIGIILLSIVIPAVWLGNRIWSPGPMFYLQERVGKAGKPYHIVKFRSMIPNAERESGAVWAAEQDPRITKFGNFLRKTRLDELPQFWNVLKGEMSVVGPRPERPQFVDSLAKQIPFYRSRHAVKPGLTGWAQVKYRYGSSVEDALVKLQYDIYYIRHQSLWLNFYILCKTVSVVLHMQGR